jgi:sirohydrochlorin cobaltochelatase
LEPVSLEEVAADRDGYERVIAEIKRGLELVTGLSVVIQSKQAGWIGLQCTDEEMALWLLRAIVVENV